MKLSGRPWSPVWWLRSVLFLLLFGTILLFFHVVHTLTLILSQRCFCRGYDLMNGCILWALRVGGVRFVTAPLPVLPHGVPLVVVSNHQSMFDIPLITWTIRSHHPRFISKRELARGIPSISLCLRKGGHALIDRRDARQATQAIRSFGETISRAGIAGCIFPEGTRARDGVMKPFKAGGLVTLLGATPTAQVVPIVITNSWKIVQFGFLPIPAPTVTIRVLPARAGSATKEFVRALEAEMRAALAGEAFVGESTGSSPVPATE